LKEERVNGKRKKNWKKKITDCVVFGFRFVVNLKFKLNMQRVNEMKLGNMHRA
jgi:hypothetical protein